MKHLLVGIFLFTALSAGAQTGAKLHKRAIVVDTHGDILSDQIKSGIDIGVLQKGGNFDLVRAKEGGLDVQVFSVWSDYTGGFALANRQIDSLDALIKRHPDKIAKVRTASELKSAVKQGKMAAMFGVEGGHMIENKIENLEALAKRGMIYMTLTWNNSTPWSSSAYEETFKRDSLEQIGLSDLGIQIIKRMNELGVIVDLSHVGETTFYDAIKASTKPVMASHSSAYVFNAHQRNLKDDQIKAIAKTGGVVFVNFYTGFLDSTYTPKQKQFNDRHKAELSSLTTKYNSLAKASEEINTKYHQEIEDMRAPLSLLIDHIDHMVKLVGSDHVGLGADYDGAESYPKGLDDVSKYPLITEALLQRGYSNKDVRKILGGNFIRLLR
ncbi:MAG: dipeptidase [Daejeonella sp.]|uniref:dipeptidase n=1 Tax=Daejeonella sp. TaxID=2805397 RepID=UPI002735D178|nr:dipeptidase [Daejeonella sp.]MDP3468405.1 dipeptidase [Daejeonella sp.]